MEKQDLKTITIYGRSFKSKNGSEFITYSYVSPKGDWFKVKFTKTCKNRPFEKGYILLTINPADTSVSRKEQIQHPEIKNINPTLWIRNVISYDLDDLKNKEHTKKVQEELNDIF